MESKYISKNSSEKTLSEDSSIVQSLINLRDELWERREKHPTLISSTEKEIFFKINSCLYTQYPVDWTKKYGN